MRKEGRDVGMKMIRIKEAKETRLGNGAQEEGTRKEGTKREHKKGNRKDLRKQPKESKREEEEVKKGRKDMVRK